MPVFTRPEAEIYHEAHDSGYPLRLQPGRDKPHPAATPHTPAS